MGWSLQPEVDGMVPPNGAPHIPVMAEAVLDWLAIKPEGRYIDCTVGAGGHSRLIATQLAEQGQLLGLDRDPTALVMAQQRLQETPGIMAQLHFQHANYSQLTEVTTAMGWEGVDGILIDAGVSSMQLDQPARGFSFQTAGPLDMRMDGSQGETAREFLARQTPETLGRILRNFGDVGPAKRIAAGILARRDANKLDNTEDLVAAIRDALPFVRKEPEEIRTVFQAIRMAVNTELESLEQGIVAAIEVLRPGGRLVVLTFHSGEDRVAKQILRKAARTEKILRPDGRILRSIPPKARLLTKKPVLPDEAEIFRNSRSKSAKLRAVERLSHD